MMHGARGLAFVAGWSLLLSCSGADGDRRLRVGHEPAGEGAGAGTSGSGSHQVGDAGIASAGNTLRVRVQDVGEMTVEVITLACAGDCAYVEAVASGGNPPYAFEWEDGSTSAKRQVCLDADATLRVSATDTPIDGAEFGHEAQTASTEVSALVLDCADGGACTVGPGDNTPAAGHYEGTGSYVCDNDTDPGAAMTINKLSVWFDFEIDGTQAAQPGKVYFQWGLVVIVATGSLDGTLDCGGALHSSLVDGVWGLPGSAPMTVVPTGTVSGDFITQRTSEPDAIVGTFQWISLMADGSYGNTCNGTYEAKRLP